jgi:hypothetical protein
MSAFDVVEDVVDVIGYIVGLLFALACAVGAVVGVMYCVNHHITVSDIGHKIKRLVDGDQGDETGFVQAMRSAGWNGDANSALSAGHKMCDRLRSDGSTPTDLANWAEANRPAGTNSAIWRSMTFAMVTNAQVYLCPDTLHNTGTPTPTTVTVTSTRAPTPTYPTRTYPSTMVATTTPPNDGADESPCRIPNQLGSCEETP